MEAENHAEPQTTQQSSCGAVGITLNIAKDTASAKSDIKSLQHNINKNRNASASELMKMVLAMLGRHMLLVSVNVCLFTSLNRG